MEHIITEHTMTSPASVVGMKVLHCESCGEWISLDEVCNDISEFRNQPCGGPREHKD